MQLLNGNLIADRLMKTLAVQISRLTERYLTPSLAIVLIGNDPPSLLYTSIKKAKAQEIGIKVKIYKLPAKVSEKIVLELIKDLNNDKKVTGILIQMPIPSQISREKVVWAIAPDKDVDGFQMRRFLPPAPMAILEILRFYGINPAKKKFLIIGKGFLIGKPLSVLATRHGARVTLADSTTADLARLVQDAQIIVAATGQPNLVTAEIVKPGQIIIDAGGGQLNGEFVGDVDFENVRSKVAAITPNPGGVGPLTVAMLASNVVKAAAITKVKQL